MAEVKSNRPQRSARAHSLFRLVVVGITLALFVRTAYHVTLATEQLFRIARAGVE